MREASAADVLLTGQDADALELAGYLRRQNLHERRHVRRRPLECEQPTWRHQEQQPRHPPIKSVKLPLAPAAEGSVGLIRRELAEEAHARQGLEPAPGLDQSFGHSVEEGGSHEGQLTRNTLVLSTTRYCTYSVLHTLVYTSTIM